MIRHRFILVFIVVAVFITQSCKTRKYTTLTWPASEYKYKPNYQDSLFYRAFINNDSTYLSKEIDIEYVLTKDSLVIYIGDNIRKYYPEYFELFRYDKPSAYLYISRFLYSNEIVFEKCYYNNNLEYEKVNINGEIQLRNVCIGTKF